MWAKNVTILTVWHNASLLIQCSKIYCFCSIAEWSQAVPVLPFKPVGLSCQSQDVNLWHPTEQLLSYPQPHLLHHWQSDRKLRFEIKYMFVYIGGIVQCSWYAAHNKQQLFHIMINMLLGSKGFHTLHGLYRFSGIQHHFMSYC